MPVSAFAVVVIAASVGGPGALRTLLSDLPEGLGVPVLVVQHRSPGFDRLAAILNRVSKLPVVAAAEGDVALPGIVYVMPSDRQLTVGPGGVLACGVGPRPGRCAADPVFASAAAVDGDRVLGVVLTGSLDDGAAGAVAIRRAGGRVLVQDRATCQNFGMPGAALATGCVDFALPLDRIAAAVATLVMNTGVAALFRVSIPAWVSF